MIESIIRFYQETDGAFFILLLIYWAFWPTTLFWVGWIFESRSVPIGKAQSKFFFPGDFSLGLSIIAFIGMHAENPIWTDVIYSWWYWLATGMIHALIAYLWHRSDAKDYPPRAAHSPTKIVHDVCGYGICLWLMVAFGAPQLIWAIIEWDFAKCLKYWLVFAACMAFFSIMGLIDYAHPATPEIALKRHPADWKPIWKK